MKGYNQNIETLTVDNDDFRRVLYTGKHLQLVLMTLKPGEEIGSEVHKDRDQFFRFEEGEGVVDIDGVDNHVEDGCGVIVPAGARHNVRNTSSAPLRFYSIYGPPEHQDQIVHATKADAEKRHADEEWDDKTTE
jgi:mannose-6-phosphate isomerase-like protein (cupin superfamily)